MVEKNKHSNYGEFIHLFSGLVKCPICGEIMSSSESFKYPNGNLKVYYHLRCKNPNCKGKGLHYNTEKIEAKIKRVLDDLTLYMLSYENEIITSSSTKTDDIKQIDKAISKLKIQEKRLVDLYLDNNIDLTIINQKNDKIKKELQKLNQKKLKLDSENDYNEYIVELDKKLSYSNLDKTNIAKTNFSFMYDLLSREVKKEMIHKFISLIEIERDEKYNITIKNIKFTDEFISKSSKEYLEYLNQIIYDNNIGLKFETEIDENKLNDLKKDYDVLFVRKIVHSEYSEKFLKDISVKIKKHFLVDGIITATYIENNFLKDVLLLIPKKEISA